jgi:polar amino acid transport system substrate-binding protein
MNAYRQRAFAVLGVLAASVIGHRAVAAAPELVVAISVNLPPYVMQKATKGIEVDLLHAALPDRTLRFVQMPYKELETAVPQQRAEAAVAVQLTEVGVFYSKPFITFTNVAITKKAAGLQIDSVADLKNRTVLAWQDAYLELGKAFKEMFSPQSPQRKNYVEVADQSEQVRMFWQGKADVIVIDRNVFNYFSVEMGHSLSNVVFHPIFAATTTFKVGFKDAAVRVAFDRGLAKLCQSGEYAKVLQRYHVELPSTVCDQH